jgi:hypothetical protein
MCAFVWRKYYIGISATIKSYLKAFATGRMTSMYRDTSTTVVLHLQHREMLLKEQEHWGWEDGCFDTQKRVSRIVTTMTIQFKNNSLFQCVIRCAICGTQ